MRSLNLDQVRSLVAIADLGSFAAAAQALHLAPPTISLHISELEARLCAQLLLRGKRGAQLTSAGQVLAQRGRILLGDAEDAVREVQRHALGLAGRVRLATQTGVVVYVLPMVRERLRQQHPEIELEVSILGTQDALSRLRTGRIDLALVTLPLPPEEGVCISPWRRDPVLAHLPPGWPAPEVVTPAWLSTQPLIFNDPSTQLYKRSMAWFGAAGFHPRVSVELNYTEAMKSLVTAGYGAALLPVERRDAPHSQALHEGLQLRPLDPPLWREMALAHRDLALQAAQVAPVLDILKSMAAGWPAVDPKR